MTREAQAVYRLTESGRTAAEDEYIPLSLRDILTDKKGHATIRDWYRETYEGTFRELTKADWAAGAKLVADVRKDERERLGDCVEALAQIASGTVAEALKLVAGRIREGFSSGPERKETP